MSAKSGSPLNNPTLEKDTAAAAYPCPYCKWVGKAAVALEYHINRYHEEAVAAEGGRAREGGGKASLLSTWDLGGAYGKHPGRWIKLNRFGTRDYGLPMWECPLCHYRVGSALIPAHLRPCQKWQDMEGNGEKCGGILVIAT